MFIAAVAFPQVDLQVQGHISIAPTSIPIGSSGVSDIGVARLQFRPDDDTGGTNMTISEIQIQATTSGTFNTNWVSSIEVYYEPKGAAVGDEGEYDHGSGLNDNRADLAANRPYTFTGSTATIDIDPTVVSFDRPGGGSNYLFVVFNLTNNVDTTATLGCEITNVTYSHPSQTLPSVSPTAHSGTGNLDDYTVTATASGEAPLTAATDDTNVPVLLLDLSLADSSTTAHLKSVRVHRTIGQDNYIAASGVSLYLDDGDNVLEPGVGAGLDGDPVAQATMGAVTAGYATLTLPTSVDVPAAGAAFFVAVTLDSDNAEIGQDFGLEVENPATDITFEDTIEDDTTNDLDPDYAYVTYSAAGLYEYDQEAYVDPSSTTAIPGSGNEFEIIPADDGFPPAVSDTVPSDSEVDVEIDTTVRIIFSEGMNVASAETSSNYTFETFGGTPVPFTLVYEQANNRTIITPDSDLTYQTIYVVTVESTITDFYGNPMTGDYVFTFTTKKQYPDFTEPAVIKNRIGSGANTEALIFVPEPPGGPSTRVSVQAFTTTGRLVRTFYKNVPHSTIGTAPISWDGTNDRGDDLGPGMYFVQIRMGSEKRVLKVMIVR
jgi:hypothetical protein